MSEDEEKLLRSPGPGANTLVNCVAEDQPTVKAPAVGIKNWLFWYKKVDLTFSNPHIWIHSNLSSLIYHYVLLMTFDRFL